jgi:hypothetical protein
MRIYMKTALAVGLSAVLAGGAASAAPVTLTGTYVTYSFDDTQLGLFGTASLLEDALVFTPTAFAAGSVNGVSGTAVQTMHLTVSANSGYQLSALNLAESGSYNLTGSASAFVTGNITALDIEGTTDNESIGYLSTSAPLNVLGATTGWTANAGVTLPSTGWGGDDGVINSISLKITNQLFVVTGPLESTADVWKNTVALNVVTSPVPEAKTYAMLLAGLGLVGFMARRGTRVAV